MALKYGFYDSVGGDRTYSARDFTAIFNNIITDGVLPRSNSRNQFNATPLSSSLGVVIDSGWAWFDSTYTTLTAAQAFPLDAADAVLYRWDAVVIETDTDARANTIKVIAGTPATEAAFSKPTLSANQHPLCYIKVRPAVTKIVQSDIENRVGLSDCPYITGILQKADLTQLFAAWQYDFDTWFEDLSVTLSGDVVTNMLDRIQGCESDIDSIQELLGLDGGNGTLPVANGGTGANNAANARTNLGIPDLTGIVKMVELSGSVETNVYNGNGYYSVRTSEPATISVPTDAIVYLRLTASANRVSGSYTSTESLDRNLIIDMTQKQQIVEGDVGDSQSLVSVSDGTITLSGQIIWSDKDAGFIRNNTPLTYYVKYLTKVTQ